MCIAYHGSCVNYYNKSHPLLKGANRITGNDVTSKSHKLAKLHK